MRRRRYALALLSIIYAINFIDRQVLAVLLPSIKEEFQIGDGMLGLLSGSAFALLYVTLGIPAAWIADRFNRKNLIASSLAVWSAMTALSALAGNVTQLLLARIGVGVGEAGLVPPAHSMIADMYGPNDRAMAMGVFSAGIAVGVLFAYAGGGWLTGTVGWRGALLIAGVPGLLLALLFHVTVDEPARGSAEQRADSDRRFEIVETLRVLGQRSSFLHLAAGSAVMSVGGYAALNFLPSFLQRSHNLAAVDSGLYLGIILGAAIGIGMLGGGYIADRMARPGSGMPAERRHSRSLVVISVTLLIATLCYVPVYLVTDTTMVLALLFFPMLLANSYLPATFALAQGLTDLRMRSMTSAILLFVINAVGLGLGPLLVGVLSDLISEEFQHDALRYSLLTVTLFTGPWAAWHFYRASTIIDDELAFG